MGPEETGPHRYCNQLNKAVATSILEVKELGPGETCLMCLGTWQPVSRNSGQARVPQRSSFSQFCSCLLGEIVFSFVANAAYFFH